MHKPLISLLLGILTLTYCNQSPTSAHETNSQWLVALDSLEQMDLPLDQKIDAIRSQGYSLYFNGNITAATQYFNSAFQMDSALIDSQFALALVNSINGHFDQSIDLLQRIIAKDSLAIIAAYGSLAAQYRFQDRSQLIAPLIASLLNSKYTVIRREALNMASVDAYYGNHIEEAVSYLKQRIALTELLYDSTLARLDHPYWDYHLIGNIFIAQNQPDSAKLYFDHGLALLDSSADERTQSVIQSDYTYFMSMYLVTKGLYQQAYDNFMPVFDHNPNGFAGIWARLLIVQNLPDSALAVLNRHARDGYFTSSLRGRAHRLLGDEMKSNQYFREVLNYHQTGEWYWQQEYALIWKEVQDILSQEPAARTSVP
jgi:tetratricopeptide (TPR) repeat protein